METNLKISGVDFPAFSCRDAVQTLIPIAWGEFRRTVNGELVHLGLEGVQKYRSVIHCEDETLPPFNQNWVGETVVVHCLAFLQETHTVNAEHEIQLKRPPVMGSIECEHDISLADNNKVTILSVPEGTSITLRYRPIIQAKIVDFGCKDFEWDNKVSWTVTLEEI